MSGDYTARRMATASEEDFPEELIRRAWAHALRKPGTQAADHEDPRVVRLTHGLVIHVALDEAPEGRFARVSIKRTTPPPLAHDDAVPLVAKVYLVGRFEPFPVDCVPGADGATLHYAIDLAAYKEEQARKHVARATELLGARPDAPAEASEPDGPTEAELAAMQLALPFATLARTWDLDKVRVHDARTMKYLSDRFLVPQRWVELQAELFLAELADGAIGIDGLPASVHGH